MEHDINIGAGFSYPAVVTIPSGVLIESENRFGFPSGFYGGNHFTSNFGYGLTIEGVENRNITAGFRLKDVRTVIIPIAAVFNRGRDLIFPVGINFGKVASVNLSGGFKLMGRAQFPMKTLTLSDGSIDELPSTAAKRRVKTLTLNGTSPEDLS